MFRDRDGNVIYVGKAKNLRTRVRSYFYGDSRSSVAQMLRDLAAIDHIVCQTEIEAEVTELRMIHGNAPRYNRRSRPPRSPQYVKLTAEEFPRLSVVRTRRDDGCLYLGPFRSRRTATTVVHALWDAVPIRRCNTRSGKRALRARSPSWALPCARATGPSAMPNTDPWCSVYDMAWRPSPPPCSSRWSPESGSTLARPGSKRRPSYGIGIAR